MPVWPIDSSLMLTSRLALGPTQSHIELDPGFFPESKAAGI